MTILIGSDIEQQIKIDPFYRRTKQNGLTFGLGPAGYDVRIAQDVILTPNHRFELASIIEHIEMPNNIIGFVYDKSTWARQGLSLFNTVIEPGWCGYLTVELSLNRKDCNHLIIIKGTPIAQIIFQHLSGEAEPYDGKYQNQPFGPQPAILE